MELLQTTLQKTMTFISLLTAFGVFMHDGRVDRAAVTAVSKPSQGTVTPGLIAVRFKSFLDTDAHTHPDHNTARAAYFRSFKYQSPSVPPRREQQHKHVLSELETGGRHAFDNTNLPVLDNA